MIKYRYQQNFGLGSGCLWNRGCLSELCLTGYWLELSAGCLGSWACHPPFALLLHMGRAVWKVLWCRIWLFCSTNLQQFWQADNVQTKLLLILLLMVAFEATMEMLIVFQNPEFRCHLIQLTQLRSTTWHRRDGLPGPVSTSCFHFKPSLKHLMTAMVWNALQSLYLFGQWVVRVRGHPGGHVEDDLHGGGSVVGRGLPRAAVALQAAHEPAVRGQVDLREPKPQTAAIWKDWCTIGIYFCIKINEITTLGFSSHPREKEVFPYSSAIFPLDLSVPCLDLTFTKSKSLLTRSWAIIYPAILPSSSKQQQGNKSILPHTAGWGLRGAQSSHCQEHHKRQREKEPEKLQKKLKICTERKTLQEIIPEV